MRHRSATSHWIAGLFAGALATVTAFGVIASCATSTEVAHSVDATEAGQPVEPLAGDPPAAVSKGLNGTPVPAEDAGVDDKDADADGAAVDSYVGLVINEVDYDQLGTDDREFVELFNHSGHVIDLDGLAVVVATATAEYDRVDLTGMLPAGGYAIVAASKVVIAADAGVLRFPWNAATNNLRNTAAAAIGILDTVNGKLVDALSYNGLVSAAVMTDVADPVSFVEGNAASILDSNSVEESLIRNPNGTDTDDAAADWKVTKTVTPGSANQLTP